MGKLFGLAAVLAACIGLGWAQPAQAQSGGAGTEPNGGSIDESINPPDPAGRIYENGSERIYAGVRASGHPGTTYRLDMYARADGAGDYVLVGSDVQTADVGGAMEFAIVANTPLNGTLPPALCGWDVYFKLYELVGENWVLVDTSGVYFVPVVPG